jgi:DNA-binding response OmpR family regulator
MNTILVVDDDQHLRAALADALEDEGYLVRVARGGGEALELLAIHAVDLVLMDVAMPVLDGPTTAHALRAHSSGPAPRVLFMSAGDPPAGLDHISVGFLPKPFSIDELLSIVALHLT